MAGDFNMSLTEVPKQLRSRGIRCDCVAWYPWQLNRARDGYNQRLDFDSCGIFYIGGTAEVITTWGLNDIDRLTAVAGDELDPDLDVYGGSNFPGQPWHCYRSRRENETPADKNLEDRLRDRLAPSTTEAELS